MTMAKQIPERESDIQATIRDYLRWTGWYVVRHHQYPSMMSCRISI